jgi:succinyl-CoA synthetase beta subunit
MEAQGGTMKLHEWQGKELLRAKGVPLLSGRVASSADEAVAAAEAVGLPVAVKAQVLVGGRGKAGGIAVCQTVEDVRGESARILAMHIKGLPVRRVLVEQCAEIQRELYVALLIDRTTRRPVLLASGMGGIEIEEVAREHPEAIEKVSIDPAFGLRAYSAWPALRRVTGDPALAAQAVAMARGLYDLFLEVDASLVEINPLVVTTDGKLLALDAKVLLDDNALEAHPELAERRDLEAEDPRELDARDNGLSFVALEGEIGCIVNGAGLAMGTMDMVKRAGGQPANFLDVGGSSRPEKVLHAVRIILEDPGIKVILLNIFGGITRCDDIARGLLEAKSRGDLTVPVVARLTGTNEPEAKALLEGSGITMAPTMEDAVDLAARMARGEAVA